jgi:hypothetical protein
MNEARRTAVRVISNLLEALATELNGLADEEKKAFGNRPAGSQHSFFSVWLCDLASVLLTRMVLGVRGMPALPRPCLC